MNQRAFRCSVGGLFSLLGLLLLAGCTQVSAPVACFDANPTIGYAPLSVTFDATCSSSEGVSPPPAGEFTYVWDFDDGEGESSTAATIGHTFSEPGTYLVQLALVDAGGVPQDGAWRTITVLPTP